MKVNISLNELGPAMWFLGDDIKRLKITLTFANPGPFSVDFSKLTESEQTSLLCAIRDKKVNSDIPFDELYKFFRKEKTSDPVETPPPEVEEYLQKIKGKEIQERLLQKEAIILEKNRKNIERLKQNLKGTIRAVRCSLAREEDLKQLALVLKLEEEGKNRKSIIDFITERMSQICQKIDKKSLAISNLMKTPEEKKTFQSDVIESESKIVRF